MYKEHDERHDTCCNEFTNYEFTRYVDVLGARLLDLHKDITTGFPSACPPHRSSVHQQTWAQ
jgi:hypothetical protein